MDVDWFEIMQRLAAGARAKVAEDRRRLEELRAQKADARGGANPEIDGRGECRRMGTVKPDGSGLRCG
jgi:hypothetical protein